MAANLPGSGWRGAYRFVVKAVYRQPKYAVSLAATLWHIVKSRGGTLTPEEALTKLRAIWQARIVALYGAGWPRLTAVKGASDGNQDRKNKIHRRMTTMINCPPVKVFHCNRARLCPFCYARLVIFNITLTLHEFEKFITMKSLEYNEEGQLLPDLTTTRLLALRWVDEQPHDGDIEGRVAEFRACFNGLLDLVTYGGKPFGTLTDLAISPGTTSNDICVRYGALVVVHESYDLNKLKKKLDARAQVKIVEYTEPDSLLSICRWCFPYPVGMLVGDAETAWRILESCEKQHTRLTQYTGVLDACKRLATSMRYMRVERIKRRKADKKAGIVRKPTPTELPDEPDLSDSDFEPYPLLPESGLFGDEEITDG